jgi:hypothetical protein
MKLAVLVFAAGHRPQSRVCLRYRHNGRISGDTTLLR